MSTETGTEAHSVVGNTPVKTDWRHGGNSSRFDPAPAYANLNLMSKILKPPRARPITPRSSLMGGRTWFDARMSEPAGRH